MHNQTQYNEEGLEEEYSIEGTHRAINQAKPMLLV